MGVRRSGTATPPKRLRPGCGSTASSWKWPDKFIYPDGGAPPVHEKAKNFTQLETGIYLYQGLTPVTNWWLDDLAVGPARVGCD